MKRVLVASLKQETATFNPVASTYDDFHFVGGGELLDTFADTSTEVAGALETLAGRPDVETVPCRSAQAVPGGPVRPEALRRILDELLASVEESLPADGVLPVLHGAMACAEEPDPEGALISGLRVLAGDAPLVASLDLHAVLTDRMIRGCDVLVPFHTYPHTDQHETGCRAARALLGLLDDGGSRQKSVVVFSDAADATSSGASGDSNAILRGLIDYGYGGRSLSAVVDAPAVARAAEAGVGAVIDTALGGTLDPARFEPLAVRVRVKSLSDGVFRYENGTTGRAGRTAVLQLDGHSILAVERPVFVVGQRVFRSHGLDPADFDLVAVKSPNGFRPYYEPVCGSITCVDVPGCTSANLRSLPYQRVKRPIHPLDGGIAFSP